MSSLCVEWEPGCIDDVGSGWKWMSELVSIVSFVAHRR